MAYGPRIYELAAPLHTIYEWHDLEQLGRSPYGLAELTKALLTGYKSYNPLSQTELSSFPLFQALRLFAGLSWAVSKQNLPAWKEWLQLNGAATIHHIVALLDEYKSNAIDKKFFISNIWRKKNQQHSSMLLQIKNKNGVESNGTQ